MRLRPTRIEDVPVPELSGLALAGGDRPRLLAIGDRKRVLAHATLTDGPLDWSVVDLGGYGLEREHGQFEGIATAADGKVLVLCEDPPVVLVLDLDTKGVESVALAGDLFEESSSSGEGVTLLADGRLLVAKEKDPPMLVELGPLEAGAEELHTLATWKLDGVEDISDLTVAGDQLFCVSDQSRRVVAVQLPLDPDAERARITDEWDLDVPDRDDEPDGKPEGLVVTDDGTFIAGLDTKTPTANLCWYRRR